MLALNVARDMSVRFKHNFAAANGPFYFAVHDDTVSFNGSIDDRLRRNEQRRALHVALNLTIDLDQALCRHAPPNLQTFCNDSSSALEHDAIPHPLATRASASIPSRRVAIEDDVLAARWLGHSYRNSPLSVVRGDFNVTACIDYGVDQLLDVGLISGDLDEHVTSSCPKPVYGIRFSVKIIGLVAINALDRDCHGKSPL